MDRELDTLLGAVARPETRTLVALTGAGVSAPSGLAVFRGDDPKAIWSRDVTEIATAAYFHHDPVGWWQWFLERFRGVLEAEPNPAHRALAELEQWQKRRGGEFLLVTQNVDPLHEKAGTEELVKVHGTADRVRCSRPGCRHGAPTGSLPRDEVDLESLPTDPRPDNLPRCPECGALIRAHALLFDEYYGEHVDYAFERVEEALGTMDLLVFVGTSLSVGVTELALRAARLRRVPAYSIDPAASTLPAGVTPMQQPAETLLPALLERLHEAPSPLS